MKNDQSNIPYSVESIAVREFFEDYGEQLQLRLVTTEKSLSRSTIRERSVNRPALAVTGYFKYFAHKRIQLFGAGEMGFFREQSKVRRKNVISTMAGKKIPCVVVTRNLAPTQEMIEVLEDHDDVQEVFANFDLPMRFLMNYNRKFS